VVLNDIVESDTSLHHMTCRFYAGKSDDKQPARIICTSLQDVNGNPVPLNAGNMIRFFFTIKNPTLDVHERYFPVLVYSVETQYNRKNNFDYVEQAVYVHDPALQTTNNLASPITQGAQLQYGNPYFNQFTTFTFSTAHTNPITAQDYYILRFLPPHNISHESNLPNMKCVPNAVTYGNPVQVQTTLCICKNLNLLVIQGNPSSPIPAGGVQLMVSDTVWKVPDHFLVSDFTSQYYATVFKNERSVDAYASYYYARRAEYVKYTEKLPTGQAVVPGLASPQLNIVNTLSVSLLYNYAPYTDVLQSNDYIFTLQSNLLWKIKRVVISLPPAFQFRTPDCMEWEGSTMSVAKCWIDVSNRDIWIHIFHDPLQPPYSYQTYTLKIRTMNYAVQNPSPPVQSWYLFDVKMYNWTTLYDIPDSNTTFITRNGQQGLFYADTQNVSSFAFTTSVVNSQAIPQPALFHIPYERYIEEYPNIDIANDRSSIQFDLQIPVTLPNLKSQANTTHHTYMVYFPTEIQLPVQQYRNDVLDPRIECMINGIQLECSSPAAGQMKIQDQEARTAGDIVNIFITATSAYSHPESQGFKWSSSTASIGQYRVAITDGSNSANQYLVTGPPMPFHLSTTSNKPDNGIYSFTVDYYATRLAGYETNFIEFKLQFT